MCFCFVLFVCLFVCCFPKYLQLLCERLPSWFGAQMYEYIPEHDDSVTDINTLDDRSKRNLTGTSPMGI